MPVRGPRIAGIVRAELALSAAEQASASRAAILTGGEGHIDDEAVTRPSFGLAEMEPEAICRVVGAFNIKGFTMKKIAIALATVASIVAVSAQAPAEARGGRNAAAIGLGIAGAAIIAGAAANAYNSNNYYYDRGYYGPSYGATYYEPNYYGGSYYAPSYGRSSKKHRDNQPSPVDMNPYSPY